MRKRILRNLTQSTPRSHAINDAYSWSISTAISGQQQLVFANTSNKLDANVQMTPTELSTAKEEMGPKLAAKLDHQILMGGAATRKINNESQGVLQNFDNPIFLSNVTPAPINHAVDKVIIPQAEAQKGEPLTLTEQSQLLSTFKAPVQSFQNRISAGLQYGDMNQRLDAARALAVAKEKNPILVKGMTKDEMALADMYASKALDPKYQTPDGADKIRDEIYKVDEDTQKERARQVNTYVKDHQLNDAIVLKNATVKALGLKPSKELKLPAGLTNVYMNLIRDNILRTGDTKQARDAADFEIKQNYGQDNNGKVKFMPPEKVYTNLGYVLQNDKLRAVKEMVDVNKKIKADGGYPLHDIEWPDEPDLSDLLKEPITKGPVKLKIDGHLRELEFDSDLTTQFSTSDDMSWSLGYVNEYGIVNPLINPNSRMGTYRFVPNKELYIEAQNNSKIIQNITKHEMSDYEKQQLDIALKKRNDKFLKGKDLFKEQEKAQNIQEFLDVGGLK